jgi:hypothetical protein
MLELVNSPNFLSMFRSWVNMKSAIVTQAKINCARATVGVSPVNKGSPNKSVIRFSGFRLAMTLVFV